MKAYGKKRKHGEDDDFCTKSVRALVDAPRNRDKATKKRVLRTLKKRARRANVRAAYLTQ
jgi:hypothetical protein